MRNTLGLTISMVVLSACIQTRDPNVVSIKQIQDEKMHCQAIEVEYKTNTEVATYKISKTIPMMGAISC